MTSPESPATSLVSANIKLFNSKSDSDTNNTIPNITSTTTTNNKTISHNLNGSHAKPVLPPLPPKPIKVTHLGQSTYKSSTPPPPPPPTPPPLPQLSITQPIPPPLPSSSPPPLPSTPPRLIRTNVAKNQLKKSQPSPIIAQKSGSSTLKGMLGKVVGSVSGMYMYYLINNCT
jgi:p21-activated kinase 1